MKFKAIFTLLLAGVFASAGAADKHYVGGDVSLTPEYEKAGAQYRDREGRVISDVIQYFADEGMNAMRVRLFVEPKNFPNNDPNVRQDLEYIIPICQRIKQAGLALMLDFHYSDTWADPAKQWTPLSWQNLTDSELYKKIYDYTKETLQTLKENGVVPDMIQPGNEISYGMLWGAPDSSSPKKTYSDSDANWGRFCELLKRAIKACREECPDAKIVIHTERVANQKVQKNFYDRMEKLKVPYDIIGLSYYPYFHGKMEVLESALTQLETDYPDKQIMVVETGYPYAWEVPGTNKDVDYPYSDAGQNQFAEDLVETLRRHEACTGIFWWWPEYNAYKTSLNGWYNAALFDSRTGKVSSALRTLIEFTQTSGVESNFAEPMPESEVWYDLTGRVISKPEAPGLYIRNRKPVLIK